ncbi:putative major facilitator superfamily protein [Pyrococcus sp. ST04]|nr:putative major facilitator superfamily protein [Pyrococcus sp. ST04]
MLYHTIIEPQLIVWLLLPLYMMYSGYSVLDVGIIFTVVNIASIPITYVIGKIFNKFDIKKGLMIIDILDGIAYILYGLAHGTYSSLMFFLGRLIEKISTLFYPLYRAYEQIIYPKDKYEEIFAWHLRLPEISKMVAFPILGYLFGYVFTGLENYRKAFILFGLLSIPTTLYIYYFLPPVRAQEKITQETFKFKVGEFKVLLIFEALFILGWSLAPDFIMINYIVFELKKTIFEVTIVSCISSAFSIIGTYISEKIPKKKGFQAIAAGMALNAIYALIMSLSPPFSIVMIAYAIGSMGDSIWFPFYRAWQFSLIPEFRAPEFHAAISSYRKIITLITPFIAGILASIHPTMPYATSLATFLAAAGLFIYLSREEK